MRRMVVQKWKKKDEMRIQWATRNENEKNENTVDETHNEMEMKRRKWK